MNRMEKDSVRAALVASRSDIERRRDALRRIARKAKYLNGAVVLGRWAMGQETHAIEIRERERAL